MGSSAGSGARSLPRAVLTCLVAALLAAPLVPQTAAASIPTTVGIVPDELLIGFAPGVPAALRDEAHALAGAIRIGRIPTIDVDRVRLDGEAERVAAVYRALPIVEFVEGNGVGMLAGPPAPPNDPHWNGSANWRLTRANILPAWARWPGRYVTAATKPRNGIVVAVLDGWIDVGHRDFRNLGGSSGDARRGGQLDLRNARSIVPASAQRGSFDWHGTFIAGIVAAAANNGVDVAGVAYGAHAMPVVVADGLGRVTVADAAAGIVHALARDARVLNASFAIPDGEGRATLRRAVDRVGGAGAVLVAAAGNSATSTPMLPAAFARDLEHVIAVAATNALDTLAPCSSYGSHVTLSAPGADVVSLKPGGGTMFAACGTSAATAMVSGAAAAVASRLPGINPAALRKRLEQTADDIEAPGRDARTGAGRLNLDAALAVPAPRTVAVRPASVGASEQVTIVATSSSLVGIDGAEVVVDKAAGGRAIAMRAANGGWGAHRERITTTIDTRRLAEGVHDLAIRARSGRRGWGPAAIVPLVVDRHAPSVPTLKTEPPVVVPGDPATRLHLTVLDALSRTVDVLIEFVDAGGVVRARHRYELPPGAYQAPWRGTVDRPGGTRFTGAPLSPGRYVIRAVVVDEAGRRTVAEGTCVVAAAPPI